MFLKSYASEHNSYALVNADEKTYRKWCRTMIKSILTLRIIDLNRRFLGGTSPPFLCSVDGTDSSIFEPTPFSPKWYSHKLHGAGLRYKVGISVALGEIVWVNGPFPCGAYCDLKIFRSNSKDHLMPRELVVDDREYKDLRFVYYPTTKNYPLKFYSLVRARHENVNRRLKQFNVLNMRFRHHKSFHGDCFHAVANIVELMLELEDPLFQIMTN